MGIYMKADSIQGNVKVKNHEGWIEINHFIYPGISNIFDTPIGKTGDRITRRPDFSEITLTKPADISSVYFFERAFSGDVLENVDIHFVSTGNPAEIYEQWQLKNVLISNFSTEHDSAQNLPIETMSLNYTSIQRTFTSHLATGVISNPIVTGYNLTQAKKL